MRLTRKLLIPTLIVLMFVFMGLVAINYVRSANNLETSEAEKLTTLYEVFNSQVESQKNLAVALATQVSGDPLVREAFANRDRETLVDETLGSYLAIRSQFDVSQMQFHEPPAKSFVRLHQLDKYGDDLSSFRATVVEANAKHRAVSGIEIGRGGLGVRGVVPVSYNAEYIGTVEYGLDIGQDFLNVMKDQYNADWTLLLSKGPAEIATFQGAMGDVSGPADELLLQASTLHEPIYASADAYTRALAGELVVERLHTEGGEFAILSAPVYDYSHQIIGVVDIITDFTVAQQLLNQTVITTLGILLISLLLSGLLIGWLMTRMLRPVGALTVTANAIAAGDLSQTAQVASKDEIGELAVAFNSMTGQMRGMIGTLEQRVADRTRALETSAEVSHRLSTILDQDELVTAVVAEVQQAFNYYHAQIYLFDEPGENLVMVGGTGEAGRQMLERGHKIPKGRGLVGRAAESGKAVLVADTTADPAWLPNPLLPETLSEAAVPIMSGGKVLGVLDVQQNTVDGLTEQDVSLLTSVANQVAVAVQNARLYTQMQRQAEREMRVNLIGQKVQQSLTVEDALQVALRELSLALDAPRASIQVGMRRES
jgi:putative methionine-R-sulfoxide reductase with GAF domain